MNRMGYAISGLENEEKFDLLRDVRKGASCLDGYIVEKSKLAGKYFVRLGGVNEFNSLGYKIPGAKKGDIKDYNPLCQGDFLLAVYAVNSLDGENVSDFADVVYPYEIFDKFFVHNGALSKSGNLSYAIKLGWEGGDLCEVAAKTIANDGIKLAVGVYSSAWGPRDSRVLEMRERWKL